MGSPPGHSEAPALGVMQDRVRLLCVVFDKYVEAQVATAFSKAPLGSSIVCSPLGSLYDIETHAKTHGSLYDIETHARSWRTSMRGCSSVTCSSTSHGSSARYRGAKRVSRFRYTLGTSIVGLPLWHTL